MNLVFLLIISVPLIEIYLFIKIGSYIGAFNTVTLIIITAIIGVIYARYEGFNTLKSAMSQLIKNQIPIYEIMSGAVLAFAALLLILTGFSTYIICFLLIFPFNRKIFFKKFKKKYSNQNNKKQDFINGEFEDIDSDENGKV